MPLHHTSQHSIARRAFWRASDELLAAMNAGTISPQDADTKHRALKAAYDRRRDAIELASFLGSRGYPSMAARVNHANTNTLLPEQSFSNKEAGI